MNLSGDRLVLPIIDAELTQSTAVPLCNGVRIFTLADTYAERLTEQPDLIARYRSSLQHMTSAIEVCPSQIEGLSTSWLATLEAATFCAMTLRLATGIPVDTPFWFDVRGSDDIAGCGISRMRTYRTGNRYQYPLDQGEQAGGLSALQAQMGSLLEAKLSRGSSNPLIRAIEFSAIAFQTRHILARIVNNTIFVEALFSGRNTEIAFQIAASVSWYLEDNDDDKRKSLFSEVKRLYDLRSKIVHGSSVSEKGSSARQSLEIAEMLNTRIFRAIMERNHVAIFGLKEQERAEGLRLLCLGAGGRFMERI